VRGVELLEDRLLREAVGRREVVADVAEGRPGQQVEPVRERLAEDRGEVPIADRERRVQAVVEGQVGRCVVAHGPAAGRVGRIDVGGGESVHASTVDLLVDAGPAVVQVGDFAIAGLMEGRNRRPGRVHRVGITGARRLGRRPRLTLEVQLSEVVIERAVLLHQDQHVLDLARPGFLVAGLIRGDRLRAPGHGRSRQHGQCQSTNCSQS
jgi:hypothetical protein